MKKTFADNEMADRLNLTVKRVKQLEESGVLIRKPDGDFDIERNASRYGLYKEKDVCGVGREIERLTKNIDAGMKRLRAATPTQRIKLGIALGPLIGQLLAAFSLSIAIAVPHEREFLTQHVGFIVGPLVGEFRTLMSACGEAAILEAMNV